MKKTNISEATINKTANYFVTIKNLIDGNGGKLTTAQRLEVAKSFSQSWNVIKIAIKLGYIDRIERGRYIMPFSLNSVQIAKIIALKNKINNSRIKFNLSDVKREVENNTKKMPEKRGVKKYNATRHRFLVCSVSLGRFVLYTNLKEAQEFAEQEAMKKNGEDVYVTEIKEKYYSRTNVYKSTF